jgi:hypothetical protein
LNESELQQRVVLEVPADDNRRDKMRIVLVGGYVDGEKPGVDLDDFCAYTCTYVPLLTLQFVRVLGAVNVLVVVVVVTLGPASTVQFPHVILSYDGLQPGFNINFADGCNIICLKGNSMMIIAVPPNQPSSPNQAARD